MTGLTRLGLGALLLAGGLAVTAARLPAEDQGLPRNANVPVKIGMVGTLFRDQPPALVLAMMKPFGSVMKAQTGVPGELVVGGDPFQLAKMLIDNEVQLGVFHGIEYGWVREKHPELQPLMIAVSKHQHVHCALIVRASSDAEEFADLEGGTLALPKGTREHTRLFLNKHCQACGHEQDTHFKKTTIPPTIEDALEDVVDGNVTAALVDEVGFEEYKRRKPTRCTQLRSLIRSEVFPSGAIVYHPGFLDEATLKRFRHGMLTADKSIMGKQMLMMWRLTGFEPVPKDYDETLKNIIKVYPPPPPERAASK